MQVQFFSHKTIANLAINEIVHCHRGVGAITINKLYLKNVLPKGSQMSYFCKPYPEQSHKNIMVFAEYFFFIIISLHTKWLFLFYSIFSDLVYVYFKKTSVAYYPDIIPLLAWPFFRRNAWNIFGLLNVLTY